MPNAKKVLENWFEAIEAKDIRKITGLLAEDVSVETESMRTPIMDRQMLAEVLTRTMAAYESIRITPKKVLSSGRDAAALVNLHVEFGADVDMMGEKLATAGKTIDVMAALFVEINDAGKITRAMRVRDTLGIIDQLGLSPELAKQVMHRFESMMKDKRSRAA